MATEPDVLDYRDWPTRGCIETDRFCDRCGYNLRTQPVRREPRTQVLMCRCPECAAYHPALGATVAGRAWLARLALLFLLTWITLVVGALFLGGVFDFVIAVEHFQDCTTYTQRPNGTSNPWANTHLASGLPPDIQSGRVLRPYLHEEQYLMLAVYGAGSLGLGLATGIVAAIALIHWRRWNAQALVLIIPLIAGACALLAAWDMAYWLLGFGRNLVIGHTLVQWLGGILGVAMGRPAARLCVRMVVPPSWRGPLTFLWLADGKPLPTMGGANSPTAPINAKPALSEPRP